MKTILIKPNSKLESYGDVAELSACEPPIWMAILANFYKADILIDAEVENYSHFDIYERMEKEHPDRVIIFSIGSHPSAHIQQEDFSKKLGEFIRHNFPSIDVKVINRLPVSPTKLGKAKWNLLPMEKYKAHNWHSWSNNSIRQPYGVNYTSISCPYSCEFCCVKDFYGEHYEARLIEDVIDDFKDLHAIKVVNIKLMDELFILNKKRVNLITDQLKDFKFNIWAYGRIDTVDKELLKKLKSAGVNWLAYGIESGNDEIRKASMKGNLVRTEIKDIVQMTKDAGINVVGNYMFGFWEDNYVTMQETLDLALELNCEYSNFYCTVAYPGSKLYLEMLKNGVDLPSESIEYAQMSSKFKPLQTKHLTSKQVLKFRDDAFNQFHSSVSYLSNIQQKFGLKALSDISKMLNKTIKRDILQ